MTAELVAFNGRVFTAQHERPWTSAFAITDGRFVQVGDDEGARSLIGPPPVIPIL